SVNPWRFPGEPGGRFTITIRPDAEPGQTNTLPLAPPGAQIGAKASLIYRVYLPAGGDSAVELPTITLHYGGESVTLPRCTSNSPGSGSGGPGRPGAGQSTDQSQHPSGGSGVPSAPETSALPQPAGEKVFAR